MKQNLSHEVLSVLEELLVGNSGHYEASYNDSYHNAIIMFNRFLIHFRSVKKHFFLKKTFLKSCLTSVRETAFFDVELQLSIKTRIYDIHWISISGDKMYHDRTLSLLLRLCQTVSL